MSQTITPDGAEVTYSAVYWRCGAQLVDGGHESIGDALRFLFSGEDASALSSDGVLADATGEMVIDFSEVSKDELWGAFDDGRLDEALMRWAGPRQIEGEA